MASNIEIINSGLLRIGEKRILSIDDNTKRAKLAKELYPGQRDFLLRQHPWKFAIKSTQLAPEVVTPPFGWMFQFNLPGDFLRVVEVALPYGADYAVEGGKLFCNYDVVDLRYVRRVEVANEMDPLFREALSCRMGREMARALTDSDSKVQEMDTKLEDAMSEARMAGGIENPQEVVEADDWIYERF